jgi:hypothetical protein
MSIPSGASAVTADLLAVQERRIRIAKRIVLSLACVVAVTIAVAVVFGIYNYTTERPAKELFQ